ncbi:PucR family transcriptional regulator [Paraburkholderia youngii]|uniref:PucR family transcriptional regulator n=1 Tax=Paraburkholderia youngii TaxID=2782701 RepID=A0A7Y6K2T4_9BURK|nr:helix-turn-helix domain-containing protein [Paraburkholderia youngii]NUY02438.1 PucR family transcriptional regulator [Paraburkholderia youngii]
MKLDGYQALAPAVRDDILRSVARSADLWFALLLAGATPADDAMAEAENSARRRVHQQVPLQSILRAFQLGAREIWHACTELAKVDKALAGEMLFVISPFLFDHFDDMAQIFTNAYVGEQFKQERWRDAIVQQLYAVVFHAPTDHAGFTDAIHALGLDATVPRLALTIDAALDKLPPELRNREIDRLTLSVARHFQVLPETLVEVLHHGRAVFWIPCGRGETISRCDRTAYESAQKIGAAEQGIRAIGVGLMNQGAAGWAASATEGLRAIELAPRGATVGKVYRYSSIALEESVRATANVLRYLVSLVEQLDNEPELLATLTTFFAQGRRRRTTADALGIHPNTLNYRLERIEKMLGASLDDAAWIAKLDIAISLRQRESGGGPV